MAEAVTIARLREKARYLWEALDFLEGTVLRTLDTQVAGGELWMVASRQSWGLRIVTNVEIFPRRGGNR